MMLFFYQNENSPKKKKKGLSFWLLLVVGRFDKSRRYHRRTYLNTSTRELPLLFLISRRQRGFERSTYSLLHLLILPMAFPPMGN